MTLIFALLGFLSPAQRGSLLQSMMLLFTLMGVLGGYTSARLCKAPHVHIEIGDVGMIFILYGYIYIYDIYVISMYYTCFYVLVIHTVSIEIEI